MDKPNVKMVRVDARLIHGQGQLWIKSLGVNLVICANDKAAEDNVQQILMKTVLPKDINVRFWTIARTAEVIWKAAPHQTIFVVVENLHDALKLCELGFPMEQLNIGNIHAAEGKEKISQFIYLGEEDKNDLKKLKNEHHVIFTTKTSPMSNDGSQHLDALMEKIKNS
ncbi:PTS sugar transporter subunit IIB [Candidatus Enterococcus courvalinii]|uniref:PTS sugar transporter subunit IIB n=1 Tax=Candidatus Enterococcus courvalinii TaxID=2815329 RepID=A0ABS3I345_9ENTE|nr:PTS sugar transporter subunit IIB [Enterococcus sp. MSG2901]MBO0482760.1 PTS sugar transporter subunit IIB [Enterococcus sp. MSG2901]